MVLIILLVYFALLYIVSRLVGNGGNEAFFRGNRKSPWAIVAFGMIGASLSGATFISVPGMVLDNDMTYIQMCIGFFFGYLVVSLVLLPIYYKSNLTSIYGWLQIRFGYYSHKAGAIFFILSKFVGAAIRMYVVCLLLQRLVFDSWGVKYELTVLLILSFIWLYTYKSGVKALVWTDSLQTLFLLTALVLVVLKSLSLLELSFGDAACAVWNDSHCRFFEFEDFASRQHFIKQFLSGVFITIVMTGLDQGLMQKNLTCKDLRSAQKDMCSYGIMFIPINLLFLALGVLMIMLYDKVGLQIPEAGDSLMIDFITGGYMGDIALVLFIIGVIAPAFSSVDSSITALTTCICVDILDIEYNDKSKRVGWNFSNELIRRIVHVAVMFVFAFLTIIFNYVSNGGVVDTIYTVAGYTYGPLLGLFAFGLLNRRMPMDKIVPFICVLSPIVCYVVALVSRECFKYEFGYELLLLNGCVTYVAIYLTSLAKYKHIHSREGN